MMMMMIMMVNGDDYDEGDDNDDGDDDDVGKSALRQWVLARAGGGDRKTKIGGPAIYTPSPSPLNTHLRRKSPQSNLNGNQPSPLSPLHQNQIRDAALQGFSNFKVHQPNVSTSLS